jgi:hypothetical protein
MTLDHYLALRYGPQGVPEIAADVQVAEAHDHPAEAEPALQVASDGTERIER